MHKYTMDNEHACLTIQKDNEHVWINTQTIKGTCMLNHMKEECMDKHT